MGPMPRLRFAALLLCILFPLAAQGADTPCIGLVLGGGGARGAAHIGVIEVLEREHIPICRIAGTSMGSIVGGMYAAGYTPAEMRQIISSLDWNDLFSDQPARVEMPMRRKEADYRYLLNFEIGYKNGRIITPVGVVQGQKLLLFLRRLLISTWDVEDFDKLPIPFRAVATDIVFGKAVVFGSGDLPLAIRSSMSVPGAFAPVTVGDRLLVDGGVMDNVPVDVMRAMGAQRMIVVDVGTPLSTRAELSNPLALLNQMVGVQTIDRTEQQIASLDRQDILIRPALGDLSSSEFNRAEEAMAIGTAAADEAVPRLRALAASPQAWQRFVEEHRRRNFDPALVAFLHVDESKTTSGEYIQRKLAKEVGKPLDPEGLEQQIGTVYGRGAYQQIDYHLESSNGERGIEIIPVDKPWGPVYGRFGLQLDDDFNGNSEYLLSAEINATEINRYGAEWRTSLWIGRIGGIRTEFFQPFGTGARQSIMPYAIFRNEDVPIYDDNGDKQLADYRFHRSILGVEGAWSPESFWNLILGIERGHDNGELRVGSPTDFPSGSSDYALGRVGVNWDSLDDAQFPAHGAHVQFTYNAFRPVFGADHNGDVVRLIADWVPNWDLLGTRYHLLLGARAASAVDNANFLESQNFLGGFLNLSGFPERGLFGNQLLFGRAVVYRQTGQLDRLFSTPFYVGASLEAGNVWQRTNDVCLCDLWIGGSLFAGLKTPLGPVFLGYGYAQGGHSALYLTFGSLLRPEQ
jgi:NTE family protein